MQPTFSGIYSVPYIILFFIFFLLFLWENKLKANNQDIKFVRIACILVFFIFFGFRGYIDTDFMLYFPLYESSPTIGDIKGVSNFFSASTEDFILKIEPGFKVFLVILKSVSSNYFFLQIISSLIDVLFLNYFFKKYSSQYVLGFIMFCIFSGLIIEINLIRNSKAIFIFLYSLQFISERNALKYYLCNIAGLMFHSSAIFYFPLYFFLHKKLNEVFVWSFFLLGNILYLGQIKYITPIVVAIGNLIGGVYSLMAEGYAKNSLYNTGYGITIGYLEKVFTFILFYKSYYRIANVVEDEKILNIFFNLLFIYTAAYLFLSEFSVLIDRITTLFAVAYWILYPFFYSSLDKTMRMAFTCILLFFGMFKMYRSNNFIIRKYDNILWGNPSVSKAYLIINSHLEKILYPDKNKK